MRSIQPSRILVYRIGQLGDTIIALPAMWVVRKHFPAAYLALLSDQHPGSEYVLAQNVLPEGLFNEYISYEANTKGSHPKKLLEVLPKLRRGCFDTLIYLAPRSRRQWQRWRDLIFFRLAGITQFIGHRNFKPFPCRVNGSPLPNVEHEADHLMNRLAGSSISVPSNGDGSMDLGITETEVAESLRWLKSHVGLTHQDRLIGLGPGSKWSSKVWPEDRYMKIGRFLIDQFGVFPVVFGGPEDREMGNRLITHWNLGANAAGVLDVRNAAAVLAHCRLYIGNDTGTMHLAAAVKTPCVVAFSAQDWPGRWYPYGDGHVILRKALPCEGCKLRVCNRELRCLKEISVEDMLQACQRVLAHGGGRLEELPINRERTVV